MLTTKERDLWIGSGQFGAFHYDGQGWTQYLGKGRFDAHSVYSLTEARDGSIWAATERGFSHFDGRT